MTSNVDALFARNGFEPTRLYTPQGDYGRLQCTTPCTQETWDTKPALDRALLSYESLTGTITDPEAIPSCPNCGGTVVLNVHLDSSFIAGHYEPAGLVVEEWLNAAPEERLLVLDIGSGYNTPGVIRWPMERITHALPGARLVRINPEHPEVHTAVANRSLPYAGSIIEILDRI